MRSKSTWISGANSILATLANQFPSHRSSHGFPRDSIFKIAAHLFPGNRPAGSYQLGVAVLGNVMKVCAAFCLIHFLRDRLQNEAVRRRSGTLSGVGYTSLQFLRQPD